MHVNIFKSVKATWGQETELDKIVEMMQFSDEIRLRTLLYRKYKASDHKAEAEEMKITRFPAFAPCALLYGGKGKDHVIGLTDLCYLDFDHVKEESRLIETMEILRNDRNVLMASRSVSNEGLHILIRYSLKGMEFPPQRVTTTSDEMQKIYGDVYDYLGAKYLDKLGLIPDYHAGHAARLYIVSHDPELYYNPNAETLTIDLEEPIDSGEVSPFVMSIGGKLREAEKLMYKARFDEAEILLTECRDWIVSNTSNRGEVSILNNQLAQIKTAKEKYERVYELMNEVDEDLRNQVTKTAHVKIVECQHILKGITGLCKPGIDKIRNQVVEREMKLGALNREIKKKKYEDRLAEYMNSKEKEQGEAAPIV